jgi:nitroreductase
MEFQEVVLARRSVRDFESEAIPREAVQRIIDCARLAPSAGNEQPWRFYVVSGERRSQIASLVANTTSHLREYVEELGPEDHHEAASWYSSLGRAPDLVVVASHVADDSCAAVNRYLSVGAALENLLLAAANEGLAGCNVTFAHWLGRDIAEALGIPEDWSILTVVALGKPGRTRPIEQQRRPDDTVWLE